LSLKSRHTCGTIPIVVKNPPINPISSFQSKCFSPHFLRGKLITHPYANNPAYKTAQ
jgi:hypothetical protein